MLSAPSALAGLALAASQLVSASPIAGGPILSTRDLLHLQRRAELNTTDFVLEHHLGNLSPYWTPPSNYSLELPAECKVDQVSLMQRHGSRYPLASENVYSTNVSTLFQSEEGQRLLANVTGDLAFLKTWVNKLGHDDLTAPGRQQLFEHGVAVNLSYPHLYTDVLTVGNQDRVVESAQWFQAGYYGRHAVNVSTINLIEEDDVTFSPITPMDNCSAWEYSMGTGAVATWNAVYLPPIVERFDALLPGFNFTQNNIHGMLYALAYGIANAGSSPFSNLFLPEEILDFEYELDLLMNYAFGYNLPTPLGPTLGSVYLNQLLDRVTNSTGNATNLYLEFGHDTTIDLFLSAVGLANDTSYPADGPVDPNRLWRTSTQVPFAAKLITERITCSPTNGTEESWVRFLLNDAPFPLTTCGDAMNSTTGSCPLETFVEVNAWARNVTYEAYTEVCNRSYK